MKLKLFSPRDNTECFSYVLLHFALYGDTARGGSFFLKKTKTKHGETTEDLGNIYEKSFPHKNSASDSQESSPRGKTATVVYCTVLWSGECFTQIPIRRIGEWG